MFWSSFRFALRRLARTPGTTSLHVGGLAVGVACCVFALLFIRDELGYDRFHDGAERIVEVHQTVTFGTQDHSWAELPPGGVEALRAGVPGLEALTQTDNQSGLVRSSPSSDGLDVDVRFADASFFEVFAFPLVQGDAATSLADPNTTLLTASLARSLFGDADPMGRDVYLERTGFGTLGEERIALTVTGVAADPPSATSVTFDLVVSGQTPVTYIDTTAAALGETDRAYIRLATLADTSAVKTALAPLVEAANDGSMFHEIKGITTPRLVDLRLGTSGDLLEGRRLFMALFAGVAALVLLLACANYANLATALALARATEIGVRKTLGAGRSQVARLFAAEALLLSLVAGAVALGLVLLLQDPFNDLFDKRVGLSGLSVQAWALVAALVVGTGLLAGAYPSTVLARFRPSAALAGAVQGHRGSRVRQVLVVFQFAVTAVLLTATAVVFDQLRSSQTRDLGFEGDRVVTFDLNAERLRNLRVPLEEAIEAVPGVASASLASSVPGGSRMSVVVSPGATPDDGSDDLNVTMVTADADYHTTTGLRLASGVWVTDASDETDIVVNETAARALGLMTTDPAEAVGQTVAQNVGPASRSLTVVGVVRDFHYQDLHDEIRPLLVEPLRDTFNMLTLSVQLADADASALAGVEAAWGRVAPDYAFDPVFLDDLFARQVREDLRMGQLFGAFGLVAIILACFGVFGLAAHAAERRTKEVGIRKVLGASVAGLVARLSSEFARLVAIALVIALPITALLAQRWLEGFAYPAPLRPGPFLVVAVGVLALALITAGVHAVRAATADPVRALRSE